MADKSDLDARKASLAAAITAARAKLAARRSMENDSIGAGLSSINDDLDRVVHEDHTAAEREYDRIEARLAAERIRIEDDAEDEDR